MKTPRYLLVGFFLMLAVLGQAQDHVFILVDVSGSRGNDPIKMQAKSQVYNLIMGNYRANDWDAIKVTDKKLAAIINGKSNKALIAANSWACVMPFGEKSTYENRKLILNKNHPTDFNQLFNTYYPTVFSDNHTYIQIAQAFTASLAKSNNINEYYVLVVTDGLGDQDDTNSRNTYNAFEEALMLEWNNSSSAIVKNVGTLRKDKYYIYLKKVENVKGTSIPTVTPPGTPPVVPAIVDTSPPTPIIKITSPAEGRKNQETELNTETININWTCTNCPKGIKYNVLVSQYDGGKYRESKKDILSNTTSFKVPDGKFRITVSASNYPEAKADYTYVMVGTGRFGWLFFLLFLIALAGGGYYLWNKQRGTKTSTKRSDVASDEIFTPRNPGTASEPSSPSSSNDEYF